MQALLFAQDSSDLSKVAGFSSDTKMRSFAVHFDDGTERRIGPNDADESERKVFKIDGAGGEVVRRVEVGMNSLPMAIKVSLTCVWPTLPRKSGRGSADEKKDYNEQRPHRLLRRESEKRAYDLRASIR